MNERSGRPPSSLTAWHAVHAGEELDARFPAVAALLEILRVRNVDPPHVKAALEKALVDVKAARNRTREALPKNAPLKVRLLHAAAEVERLSQDRQVLSALSNAVQTELHTVTSDLVAAETRVAQLALQQEPVSGYELMIIQALRSAGMTDKHARTIGVDQINLIKDFLNGDRLPTAPTPFELSRRKAEVALAWTNDNPWGDLLADPPCFDIHRRPMTNNAQDTALFQRCGLPPFSDLEDFGYPSLFYKFEAAKDPHMQLKACWDICSKWIADHIVSESGFQNIDIMRKRAWSFLFGVRYGFAHELKLFDSVRLPSPWSPDEYVIANRVAGVDPE